MSDAEGSQEKTLSVLNQDAEGFQEGMIKPRRNRLAGKGEITAFWVHP
jgi:hypothetical protein